MGVNLQTNTKKKATKVDKRVEKILKAVVQVLVDETTLTAKEVDTIAKAVTDVIARNPTIGCGGWKQIVRKIAQKNIGANKEDVKNRILKGVSDKAAIRAKAFNIAKSLKGQAFGFQGNLLNNRVAQSFQRPMMSN